MVQEADTFFQIQVPGQRLLQMGRVQVLHGVFRDQLGLVGEVFVKRADGGHLAGPGGRGEPAVGVRAVGMDDPVPGQVVHIGIHVAEGDGADKLQIHVVNGDLVQRRIAGDAAFVQLEEAEKVPQVQKIFVHGPAGVALDGLVVDQEIPQDGRCISAIIRHK